MKSFRPYLPEVQLKMTGRTAPRDLPTKLYDWEAAIAGEGPHPGVSPHKTWDFAARRRYDERNTIFHTNDPVYQTYHAT